nr:substrate-binding domain-containing protein [Burkholderia plantarii]
MAGLREAGLTVPGDVSIVGMDGHFLAAISNPALTTPCSRRPRRPACRAARRPIRRRRDGGRAAGSAAVSGREIPCVARSGG